MSSGFIGKGRFGSGGFAGAGAAAGGGTPAALFAHVQWMCHGNGVDAAQVFVDSSQNGYTLTNGSAAATTSATQKKFGNASIHFNANDYVWGGSGANSSSQDAGLQTKNGLDFCAEAWIYPTTIGNNTPYIIFTIEDQFTSGHACRLALGDGGSNAAKLHGTLKDASGTAIIDLASSAGAIVLNTWQHVALSRASGTYRLFIDGVKVAEGTDNGGTQVTARCWPAIGGNPSGTLNGFIGYIDDVRFTNNDAVYTADFTRPAAEFPNS